MFIYKFEKGTIKTGIAIDLATDDQKMFEENFGGFIEVYNDGKHTDEELEFVYAFVEVSDDEDSERKLILTKDRDEITRMEIMDRYELADMHFVLAMCKDNVPINFYCLDNYCTLVEEEYISDDGKVSRSNYISVSWV